MCSRAFSLIVFFRANLSISTHRMATRAYPPGLGCIPIPTHTDTPATHSSDLRVTRAAVSEKLDPRHVSEVWGTSANVHHVQQRAIGLANAILTQVHEYHFARLLVPNDACMQGSQW